uniref:Cytochrome c oxidase subunit 3 n=1 Tax=Hepialus lagii (nomen nudum) TaxID=3140519 RepID=A0AAU7YTR3_9NEOP|nr:cytochrome c oxidase subunit III [Ahamus yushuensis]UIX24744.1 cytochrome c oxidase subunit 3 [Ahamus yushuensis]UJP71236.1 cytochrome c oxidase subunit 3 [Thitarodes sp. XS20]WRY71464.1 cytochrome c oxidase subunit 3 [Ahamus luquensis]
MMNHQNHPYHLVDFSPWPLTGAMGVLILMSGLIKWFHMFNMNMLLLGYFITILTMYQWWRDVCREGTFQGKHTILVSKGLQWGMILFIISEVFFFLSFFWAFFHSSLSPNIEIGMMWPPLSIISFNPFQIPLLNTIILLTSGITVTWAHHALMENNFTQSTQGLFFTVILGIYFTILQMYEYYEASFTIADSIYGSTFFMATGFHGLHVIIGTIFLLICLLRHINNHFSMNHHFGFEAAAWYWHFVDVVWLFLYISMYWWGS